MMKSRSNKKNGGILLVATLIMLIFSVLAIGLFKLHNVAAVDAVRVEQHRRALWVAETGIEKALGWLVYNESARLSPETYVTYPYSETLGDAVHSNDYFTIKSITKTSTAGNTGSVFTVEAVGYSGTMNRRIQQTFRALPGGDQNFRSKSGNIYLGSNIYVDKNIIVDVGDVITESKENLNSVNPTGVDGYIILGDGEVGGKGASSADMIEGPIPPEPEIDMNYWNPYLNNAGVNANTNGIAGTNSIYITTGVTNFTSTTAMTSDKNLEISGTASGQDGFHFLTSNQSIIFDHKLILKNQTVIIVNGDITFNQNVTFNQNCIVFATGNIYVAQASDGGSSGLTLIAQGDIEFAQNMVFHGLVYADGDVTIGQNSVIRGAVMADGDINVGSNTGSYFDTTVFLNPMLGLNNVYGEASFSSLRWTELASE